MRILFFYLTMPFRPIYWIMNKSYNKEWDLKLTNLLNEHEFTNITYYHASLNGIAIWIANHPYASFTCTFDINHNLMITVRPSRYTIYLANKKLQKELTRLRDLAIKTI